jgi:molecular chaperone GrpE
VPEAEIRDARTRSLLDGVAATERELLSVFERYGIRRIDPKGERFDHNFHQAVFEVERPDAPAGTVIEVLQPGYVLHDRLLRPAMVGVAKAPAKSTEGTDDAA